MIAPLDDSQGIELRDWFAGLAMHAMLSNPACGPLVNRGVDDAGEIPIDTAMLSYDIADHLLFERDAVDVDPESN